MRERLDRERLLAPDRLRGTLHRDAHQHLRAAAAEHHARLLHRLREDRERIMQRPLGLVDHLVRRPAQDDRARFARRDAGEFDQLRWRQL